MQFDLFCWLDSAAICNWDKKMRLMIEQFFNRTQNDAIWGLIALFLTNQNAGNTIDFKMNVINNETHIIVCDFFFHRSSRLAWLQDHDLSRPPH